MPSSVVSKRIVSGIVRIARRPVLVVALATLASALAILPASRLRVQADLATLLPEGSPAADDYRVFLERFGGLEKVFVMVLAEEGGDADDADLVHAAGLLEEVFATSPEVASVRAGLGERDEELFLRYVTPRAPLLMAGDWRRTVERRIEPQAIRRRVARLKAAVSTPAWAAQGRLAASDPLGFSDELTSSLTPSALPLDLMTSTFLAPRGDTALLILTPARSEVDPEGGRALQAELDAAYAEVRRRLGEHGHDLRFQAVGGPLYAAQDESLIRRDLQRTLTGSLSGTALVLVAAFEGVLLPLAALAPLLAALLWSAAGMGLAGTEVSAVSIGFGAVLVGLGIDYGIHGGARFRQSLLEKDDASGALAETVRHTGPGILTSALTTAAGFAVLGLAHFRPLAELGLLVPLGILAILGAVALVGSAAAVLVAPRLRRSGRRRGFLWRALGGAVEVLTRLSRRRPKLVLVTAAVLSAVALRGLGGLAVDPDLATFRPLDHPAREAEALLTERFGLGLDTANVVVHGADLRQTLERAARAGELLRQALGPEAEISDPADYLALGESVDARLRELATLPLGRAADDLERELRAVNLNPRAFARGLDALRALGRGEDPGIPPPDAWPDWLAQSISTDADGTWAALSLRLPASTWPQGPPQELVDELRSAVPGSSFASAVAIAVELRELATRDLRTLSVLALAAVAAVVLTSFRGRWRPSLLAGLPVLLGSLWTLGLWAGLGRPLDLFTLAVLPIMLGIGIDDGLHVMHGARTVVAGKMVVAGKTASPIHASVLGAGRALVLTTLTTGVGFGSLLFSHIPGLRNGGALIATGVLACLLATVMVLPAIEAAAGRTP